MKVFVACIFTGLLMAIGGIDMRKQSPGGILQGKVLTEEPTPATKSLMKMKKKAAGI